jgi:hypothetical protein
VQYQRLLGSSLGAVEAALEVEAAAAIACGAGINVDALTAITYCLFYDTSDILYLGCVAMHRVMYQFMVSPLHDGRVLSGFPLGATPKWLSAKWRRHAKIVVRK